jgi:1-acyl-sn-glycerol-3-phosphate acyltransferase
MSRIGFLRGLSRLVCRLTGWKLQGSAPRLRKCVMIGAPHTTNWDLPLALLVLWGHGIEGKWVAKHTVFRWPVGWFMRLLGGIPLDREATRDFVQQSVDAFAEREDLILLLAPEGTRSHVDFWKTGFYYIALGAGVPIVLGFVDFPNKETGLGPTLYPTGDIEADFEVMRRFYEDKSGKRPEKAGEIKVRPGGRAPQGGVKSPV